MLMTAMSTFTSMTVHCARCHDHKFDPIKQEDYYRLQAVFSGVDRADQTYFDADTKRKRTTLAGEQERATAEQKKLVDQRTAITSPELSSLNAQIKALTDELATLPDPFASASDSSGSPTNGYHSEIASSDTEAKWVQVDLGQSVPIDLVRLVPARPTDFRDTPGFGFPLRFRVAVSNDPTVATGDVIADRTGENFANPGTRPVAFAPQQTTARYVRVTAEKLWPRSNDFVFALAELQVESSGRNVAAGAAVTAHDSIEGGRWSTKNLVDGFDSRHALPDVASPDAAAALARRQTLERELDQKREERVRVAEALVPAELKRQIANIDAQIVDLGKRLERLDKGKHVYALNSHEPRPIHVLRRGDVKSLSQLVGPGALGCLPGLAGEFALADPRDEGSARGARAVDR